MVMHDEAESATLICAESRQTRFQTSAMKITFYH